MISFHRDIAMWRKVFRSVLAASQVDNELGIPLSVTQIKVKDLVNYNPDSTAIWNVMIDVLPSSDDPEVLSMQSSSDKILNELTGLYYKLRYHGEISKFYITYRDQRIAFYKIQLPQIQKQPHGSGILLGWVQISKIRHQ